MAKTKGKNNDVEKDIAKQYLYEQRRKYIDKSIQAGYSPTKAYKASKNTPVGMSRTEFLRLYRQESGTPEKKNKEKYIPKKYELPAVKDINPNPQRSKYQYRTVNEVEKNGIKGKQYSVINSDKKLTRSELKRLVKKNLSHSETQYSTKFVSMQIYQTYNQNPKMVFKL